MRICLNTLFFILLLITSTLCSKQENILELIDKSDEGRQILNAIYLELKLATPNLDRGRLFNILKTTKDNAAKAENRQKERQAKIASDCKADIHTLGVNIRENERSEFTITRHLNSNSHAIKKNQQYIDRSKDEFNQYESLRNLILANQKKFNEMNQKTLANINKIIGLVRGGKRLITNAHKAAAGQAFIQVSSGYITGLSELRVEFANTFDNLNGLRPIISSLLQTMADPNNAGKDVIRTRVIKLLHEINKSLNKSKDSVEAHLEGGHAVFEALLKNIAENKIRVQKLQERLDTERNSLTKRQGALTDSQTRAHNISTFSKTALKIRGEQCTLSRERSTRLMISVQKQKNIVAQIEEILQERFGQLKGFFLERKMKINVDI
jgi:hypothetical protein